MSPVFVNTVRASFYRFRPDLGGLRVGREILVWRTVLPQCVGGRLQRSNVSLPWVSREPYTFQHTVRL